MDNQLVLACHLNNQEDKTQAVLRGMSEALRSTPLMKKLANKLTASH